MFATWSIKQRQWLHVKVRITYMRGIQLALVIFSFTENFEDDKIYMHFYFFKCNILFLSFSGKYYMTFKNIVTATAKSLQSCQTLCDPIEGSLPGSTVPGILKARTLEWVAISFSNAWKWKVKVKSLSHVRLLATPWTAAYQVPPSMGFSRQEY